MTGIEITAIAGLITALAGAVTMFFKVRPDRDALIITQAQGAATIMNDLVETLHEELTRERALRAECEKQIAEQKRELDGLRRRVGRRLDDGSD